MFIDKLTENFNINEPIFTEEILDLFKEYSRAQVFRYIDKAKENKKIALLSWLFSQSVYNLNSSAIFQRGAWHE